MKNCIKLKIIENFSQINDREKYLIMINTFKFFCLGGNRSSEQISHRREGRFKIHNKNSLQIVIILKY